MTPGVLVHPWLDELEFAQALANPILEGIDQSIGAKHVSPVDVAQARADFLEKINRVPEAIEALTDLKTIGGDEVAIQCDVRIAKLLQIQKEYGKSIPYLKSVLKADPTGGPGSSAYNYLGKAHSALDEHEEAVAAYRQYLTKRPGALQVLLDLAGELEALGRIPEAEQLYVAMVTRFPDVALPYRKLIGHLQRQRRFDEAARYREMLAAMGQ